jgi:hypothetical protein
MDPRDPNTLYAASWERSRGPYFLKSGGPGSALWKTTDAGKTWREIKGGGFPETTKGPHEHPDRAQQPEHGLCDGRGGFGARREAAAFVERASIARPTPARRGRGAAPINNRPFYFSQIRVDPKNPNRLYRMAVDFQFSDDGGYSWRTGMLGNH